MGAIGDQRAQKAMPMAVGLAAMLKQTWLRRMLANQSRAAGCQAPGPDPCTAGAQRHTVPEQILEACIAMVIFKRINLVALTSTNMSWSTWPLYHVSMHWS